MIGIYAEVYEPVVIGTDYLFSMQNFTSYGHNIAALGGFWDASIGMNVSQAIAEDWYEHGLGRQIKIKNHLGGLVWKGFVNNINLNAGSQTLTRGPLMEVVNRAATIYTPRDFSVYPPVDGTQTTTTLENNLASQQLYGIFEQSVAAGATTEAVAEQVRDIFIEQNRLPKTTGDLNISGAGQPVSLTLDCLGNIHWLKVYPYNNFTPAVITVYEKLLQVLNANTPINPGVISTNYMNVAGNAFAVEQLEDKNRYAWDIINELLSLGNDTTDARRILGIYEDDLVWYETIPSTISYEYKLSSQRQQITDYQLGTLVYPWDVRPGKWVHTPDWLIGRILSSTDLLGDPRNKFIENVSFSAPYTLSLTGSPFDNLAQMLSKITYTGGIY